MADPAELNAPMPYVLPPGAVLAFNWLQLSGAAVLALVLAIVALNPRLSRVSTWYSFCLSWIISSLSYCLLYLSGQQTGAEPQLGLCVLQSGLIYAAPVLTVGTTLSFVLQIYLKMPARSPLKPHTEYLLQFTPYTLWLIFTVVIVVCEVGDPDSVRRVNGLYCSSTSEIPPRVTALIVLAALLAVVVIQAIIFHQVAAKAKIAQAAEDTYVLAMLFRLFLFNLAAFTGLGVSVSLLVISRDYDTVFNLLLASFPLLVALIFGLQRDILYTFLYGRFLEKPTRTAV